MSTQQQKSDGAVVLIGIENWSLWLIYINGKIEHNTYNSLMSDNSDEPIEKSYNVFKACLLCPPDSTPVDIWHSREGRLAEGQSKPRIPHQTAQGIRRSA